MRRPAPARTLLLAALLAAAACAPNRAPAADALDFRYAYPALSPGSPAHLLEALNHLRAGRPDEAVRLLEGATEDDPADFERDYVLGIAHIQLRDYRLAWRHLIRAARLAPDRADIRLALAQLEAIQRYDEEAIGWLRRTMTRLDDPDQRLEAFSLAPFRILHRNWEFRRLLREQGFMLTHYREGVIAPIPTEPANPAPEETPELPRQLKVTMQLTNFVFEALAPIAEAPEPSLRLQAPLTPLQPPGTP